MDVAPFTTGFGPSNITESTTYLTSRSLKINFILNLMLSETTNTKIKQPTNATTNVGATPSQFRWNCDAENP